MQVLSVTLGSSKLESLSPSSRWILYKNTGSDEVEREARQPRARQRHLRRGEHPVPRIMMSGLGLHVMASLCVENGPSASSWESSNFQVEREAQQPRARQRHLRCGEPPVPRIMMSSLGLHP